MSDTACEKVEIRRGKTKKNHTKGCMCFLNDFMVIFIKTKSETVKGRNFSCKGIEFNDFFLFSSRNARIIFLNLNFH